MIQRINRFALIFSGSTNLSIQVWAEKLPRFYCEKSEKGYAKSNYGRILTEYYSPHNIAEKMLNWENSDSSGFRYVPSNYYAKTYGFANGLPIALHL